MNEYENKLKEYIKEKNIDAQHFSFKECCHSVEEAAKAVNASKQDFIKSICMIGDKNCLIVAIVKGEDRASTTAVGAALGIKRPRTAKPDEMLEKTGYPCGGTPPFGYHAIFLIDSRVMEKEYVYGGGGSPNSLIKISSKEMQKANNGKILDVRKK